MSFPRPRRSRSASLGAAAIIALVNLLPGHAAEFHVATTGHDRNAGTASAPFATVERAQQAVRQRAAGDAATVWLHGGVYRLERSLQLTAADSGTPGAPVVIHRPACRRPSARPRLNGEEASDLLGNGYLHLCGYGGDGACHDM